jgi:hypothetical protein
MSFTSTLKPEEISMLRKIVRKVHFSYIEEKHGKSFVTNAECDKLIESIAPEVVENMIRFGVNKGLR